MAYAKLVGALIPVQSTAIGILTPQPGLAASIEMPRLNGSLETGLANAEVLVAEVTRAGTCAAHF